DHRPYPAHRHGLGVSPADAHGAATDVIAVVDAHTDDEKGEDDGRDDGVGEVGHVRVAPEVAEVDPVGNKADLVALDYPAGQEAGGQGEHVHQWQYQERPEHAGRDQEGDRRNTHGLQRVDLLVDPHGAEL